MWWTKMCSRNVLIVGQGADHPRLYSDGLVAKQLHWTDRAGPMEEMRCAVKTRYRQTDIPCLLKPQCRRHRRSDGSMNLKKP